MGILSKVIGVTKLCNIKLANRGNIKIHKSSHINFSTKIKNTKGQFEIGRGLHTRENVHIVGNKGHLIIGDNVFINRNSIIACKNYIKIGNNCSIGPNVCVYDHDHKFNREGLIKGEYKYDDVVIGEGCWIGAGAIILRGTNIGKNSIIGAGTVVKGNIPPCSIVSSSRELIIKEISK